MKSLHVTMNVSIYTRKNLNAIRQRKGSLLTLPNKLRSYSIFLSNISLKIHIAYLSFQLCTGMFPSCRSLIELLRLRPVCQWTKGISEDYILCHPRSRQKISIALIPRGGRAEFKSQLQTTNYIWKVNSTQFG